MKLTSATINISSLNSNRRSLGFLFFVLIAIFSIFPAMSINFSNFPLVFAILVQLLFSIFIASSISVIRFKKKLFIVSVLLVVYLLVGLFIIPFLSGEISVLNPRLGIDKQYLTLSPLNLSISNVGQFLYLTLNLLFLNASLYFCQGREKAYLKIVLMAGWIVVFFLWWQFAYTRGYVSFFPNGLLYTNKFVAVGNEQLMNGVPRINSTLTEPSLAGAVLSSFYVYYFFSFLKRKTIGSFLSSLIFMSSALITTSFTAILGILIGSMLGVYIYRRFYFYVLLAVLVVVLIIWINAFEVPVQLMEKLLSASYLHRAYSNMVSFQMVLDTYGFGVGIGSNRPSSLLASVLSNFGILGGFLLALIFFISIGGRKWKKLTSTSQAILAMLATFVLTMLISIPDYNLTLLWVFLSLSYVHIVRDGVLND